MTGLVSVVIPVKNPGKLFEQVLRAVLEQELEPGLEVIIVDSGSRDGTVEFITQTQQADGRVKLIRIEPHEFGHGRTRNLGISHAKGEFVAVITHDALPADRAWLRNLVAPFRSAPETAGVFGRHVAYPHHNLFLRRDLERHFERFNVPSPVFKIADRRAYDASQALRMNLHFFSDNNAAIRRSVWEKLPYPDVDYAEDQLWAKRMLEAGHAKAYAHDAVVYHSHEYTVAATFRRAFDESSNFRRYFGYRLIPSLPALALALAKGFVKDLLLLWGMDMPFLDKLACAWRRWLAVCARSAGQYLGAKALAENRVVHALASLDQGLRRA